jgi:hypothetical protein
VRAVRRLAIAILEPLREAMARRAPLPPLAGQVLARRPDVQKAFAVPGGGVDRLEFLRWLSTDAITHHKLKPSWAARWLEHAEGPGVMRRLLDFYDSEPELQSLFPLAFVDEHDAPAFLAWLEAHGGFLRPGLRRAAPLAAHPVARIRDLPQPARRDVGHPDALPGRPAPASCRGPSPDGSTAGEDRLVLRARAAAARACVEALYRDDCGWQAPHPRLPGLAAGPWEGLSGPRARAGLSLATLDRLRARAESRRGPAPAPRRRRGGGSPFPSLEDADQSRPVPSRPRAVDGWAWGPNGWTAWRARCRG